MNKDEVERKTIQGTIEANKNRPNFQPLPKESLKIIWLPLESIHFNPNNANEMGPGEFQQLIEAMRMRGMTNALQVRPLKEGEENWEDPGPVLSEEHPYGINQRFELIAGEHRLQAIEIVYPDWTTAPCVVNDTIVDRDAADMSMVADNQIHGSLNKKKFTALVDRLMPKYGKELVGQSMGFATQEEMDKFVLEYGKQQLPEGDAQREFVDRVKRKKVKTMEDLSRIINQLIAKYGNTIEQDFMYFNYGGHTHLMISMRRSTKAIMDEITTYCAENKINVNDIMEKVITKGWDRALLKTEGKADEETADPFEGEEGEDDDDAE